MKKFILCLSVLWSAGWAYSEAGSRSTAELSLTPEQRAKWDEAAIEQRAAMEKCLLTVKAKRGELKSALADPQVSRVKLGMINDQLKDALISAEDQRLEGILAARDILTPEQFKQWMERSTSARQDRWEDSRRNNRRGNERRRLRNDRRPADDGNRDDDLFDWNTEGIY